MTCLDQFVQNSVYDGFVEDALLPETVKVVLKGLKLDTQLIRHIIDRDGPEIRKARNGADRRKFRAGVYDSVVPLGPWIIEDFQFIGSVGHRFRSRVRLN